MLLMVGWGGGGESLGFFFCFFRFLCFMYSKVLEGVTQWNCGCVTGGGGLYD